MFKIRRSVIQVISAEYVLNINVVSLIWLFIGFLPYTYEALLAFRSIGC